MNVCVRFRIGESLINGLVKVDRNGAGEIIGIELIDAIGVITRNSPQGEVCDTAEKAQPSGEHNSQMDAIPAESTFIKRAKQLGIPEIKAKILYCHFLREQHH